MPTGDPDRLFARGEATPGGFRFDAEVARVFADMIARSVPGYAETIALTGWLADRFGRDGTHLYDLGCSLGATLFSCIRATAGRQLHATGVDSSAPMLERCRERLADLDLPRTPELLEADVRDVEFAPTSFVALNWTLQFLPLKDREPLLARIHDALVPGGALVLSEKVLAEDSDRQVLLDRLHLDFKRAQGYSELEISAKRSAIEEVLVSETVATHETRLENAGFRTVALVASTFNFTTLLAVRA